MRIKFKSMSKRAKWILHTTGVVAMVNFVVFVILAVHLGGDGLNGYVQDQHYFICARSHCHEVTQFLWRYSYCHAISSFIGVLLVFVVAGVLINTGDIVVDFDDRT